MGLVERDIPRMLVSTRKYFAHPFNENIFFVLFVIEKKNKSFYKSTKNSTPTLQFSQLGIITNKL